VGSSPQALAAQILGSGGHSFADLAGYSGPNSDGGSIVTISQTWAVNGGINVAQPFTFECWAWAIYVVTANAWQLSIGTNGSFQVGLLCDSGNFPHFVYGGAPACVSPSAFPTKQWVHLVGTSSGTTNILYVNGSAVSTVTGTPGSATGKPLIIGGDNGNGSGMPQAISEVAVYNTALSSARVSAHFNAADNRLGVPVAQSAGGVGGGGSSVSSPLYLGILQQILQAVRKQY